MVLNFWLEIGISLVIVGFGLYLCYWIIPKNEKVRSFFIKHKRFLSPNCISNWRKKYGAIVVGFFIIGMVYEIRYLVYGALWVFILLAMTDLLDGIVARYCDMATPEGAKLDAEADKWFDLPALLAFSFYPIFEPVYLIIVMIIIVFDVIGQLSRGKNSPPEAGIVGKVKTTIKFTVIYLMTIIGRYEEIYSILKLETIILVLLILAAILAGLSMGMKTKWYREYISDYLDTF